MQKRRNDHNMDEKLSDKIWAVLEITYSDSQNYVYSGKFFLSRSLLRWKKRGEILEKFIRVEQASEHKKINFARCKIKSL